MTENAQLAMETLLLNPCRGIPSWLIHIMEHRQIERLAGKRPGAYREDPERVYLAMQKAVGTCLIDQFIPDNPLSMGDRGYEGREPGATTGAERIVLDGICIDSPEAVVEHLERKVFPCIQEAIARLDERERSNQILANERAMQERIGPEILKTGYGFISFPALAYGQYGYERYFSAYALYPETMEKHFSLQADWARRNNQAAARAYAEGDLPPLYRLDHDMADSRGTLVSLSSLDRIWFPHFARALEPMLGTRVRMIWHCDGNLMQMVPRLLELGIKGFQGFQYECGMDYEKICRMKTREGEDLIIIAGVNVSRTLPFGKPDDVKRELDWLVANGPRRGLFLAGSSSITPGVPWENIQMLVAGLKHYRESGRG